MAKKLTPESILKRNRDNAAEMAKRAGTGPTRKLLEKAAADLRRRIAAARDLRGLGEDTFTLTQMRSTLRLVEEVLRPLTKGLRGVITTEAGAAAEASASGALDYLRASEARFKGVVQPLPFNEAALLDKSVAGANATVLRRLSGEGTRRGVGVLARYGVGVIEDFEDTLQQRFIQKMPWSEVRDELTAKSPFLQGKPAFWAERIVRTEVMAANNSANLETIHRAEGELGDMVKILSCVMDDRTGSDSIAVHGQIRRPTEPFDTWFGPVMAPPDRPNDRGIVVPHRIAWPIPPALTPKSDSDVLRRWAFEGRKGAPPPRPPDTTVPRELFGQS